MSVQLWMFPLWRSQYQHLASPLTIVHMAKILYNAHSLNTHVQSGSFQYELEFTLNSISAVMKH